LQQSISDLALRIDIRDGRYRTRTTRFYVGDIFRRGKPLFITVASNGGRTSVYIGGKLVETAPEFRLSERDFEGELVTANWPRADDSWSGVLRGLAFYDQELSPAQVVHHYMTWIEKGRPDVSNNERAVALYLFDERAGRVIHNQVQSGPDLYIPERYLVLDQVFLKPFWEEFHPSWSYWSDVLINIAGFVPFGFLFCAYLSLAGRIKRPALITILLGFMVSLTIESVQAFLPTRESGTTDLIPNTMGTYWGIRLYRLNVWRVRVGRAVASDQRRH
jgi:VanZ family protein